MNPATTALILIGYQNDYFATDGILRGVLENPQRTDEVLKRTVELLEALKETSVTMIATPIIFSADYSEVRQADGILRAIKDAGAFRSGARGAETVEELRAFGDRILDVPGKRGLNAFSGTDLERQLGEKGISHVLMAGAVTAICIDSTGRAAYERGFKVSVLEDCTAARTDVEQEFFCQSIFPTYAEVTSSTTVISSLLPSPV